MLLESSGKNRFSQMAEQWYPYGASGHFQTKTSLTVIRVSTVSAQVNVPWAWRWGVIVFCSFRCTEECNRDQASPPDRFPRITGTVQKPCRALGFDLSVTHDLQHLLPAPVQKFPEHWKKLGFHLINLVWFLFHIICHCSACSVTSSLPLLGSTESWNPKSFSALLT